MLTVEEICAALSTFDKNQLNQIKARCIFYLDRRSTSSGSSTKKTQHDYLKDVILFYSKKFMTTVPRDALEKNDPRQLNTKLNQIVSQIEILCKDLDLDKRRSMKLCRVLVESAVDSMKENKKPVSFGYMVNILTDPRSLLDESFPGYYGTKFFKAMVLK